MAAFNKVSIFGDISSKIKFAIRLKKFIYLLMLLWWSFYVFSEYQQVKQAYYERAQSTLNLSHSIICTELTCRCGTVQTYRGRILIG